MILFTVTMFLSATLLFLVQPMFAKMVLPHLGGTPAVWNTCMVFYQAALLAGYVYAHFATKWLGVRRQSILHLIILILPLAVLPIALPQGWKPPTEENPIPAVLLLLVVSVGLPFFVVSTSAPMLQKWFAHSGHPDAKDPYFLYAASNLGSMFSLLSYPFLVEPTLRLSHQSWIWAIGYGLLVALVGACVAMLWRAPPEAENLAGTDASGLADVAPTWSQRLRWLALSAVPSSLLLGVTTHITTDIAAAPLLWILPLVLYLLTFVMVFAKVPWVRHETLVWMQAPIILMLALCFALNVRGAALPLVAIHLFCFFITTLVCHGELAASRPAPSRLTEFYLWMSLGGLVGGMFSALLAPVIFSNVYEYPLVVVLAAILRPWPTDSKPRDGLLDLAWPAGMAVLLLALISSLDSRPSPETGSVDPLTSGIIKVCFAACALVAVFVARNRPLRLGLMAGVVMVAGSLVLTEQVIVTERSFYAVHRVLREESYLLLQHGTTLHGAQCTDPDRELEPLTYYYQQGPVGEFFAAMAPTLVNGHVAVCGLGCGGLTAYSQPGQSWVYYEIDPVVDRIARKHFTYLSKSKAAPVETKLGDARLTLANEPPQRFKLIILDAFSSDSVPAHLLSLEAIDMYLEKLADDGVLLFNISNRYLDLRSVLGNLAAHRGLHAVYRFNTENTAEDRKKMWVPSNWVVITRKPENLGSLASNVKWKPLEADPSRALWTDDYSNLLQIIMWKVN